MVRFVSRLPRLSLPPPFASRAACLAIERCSYHAETTARRRFRRRRLPAARRIFDAVTAHSAPSSKHSERPGTHRAALIARRERAVDATPVRSAAAGPSEVAVDEVLEQLLPARTRLRLDALAEHRVREIRERELARGDAAAELT